MRTQRTVSTHPVLAVIIIIMLSVDLEPKKILKINWEKIHSTVLLISRSAEVTLVTVFYPMAVFFSI